MGKTIAASAATISLRAELAAGMRQRAEFALGVRTVEVAAGRDSVWAIVRRSGRGGVALRIAHCWGGCTKVAKRGRKRRAPPAEGREPNRHSDGRPPKRRYRAGAAARDHDANANDAAAHPVFPARPLSAGRRRRPDGRGRSRRSCATRAQQRAVLLPSRRTSVRQRAVFPEPDRAERLFRRDRHQARRRGRRRVARARLSPADAAAKRHAADESPAGRQADTMSDAILVFHDDAACDEQDLARRFLQMLGAAYRQLEPPTTEYRDWVARADKTLHDLENAPEATIRHYGHTYIHPYTAAEYPDVMVQMSIISPLRNYATWTGGTIPFCKSSRTVWTSFTIASSRRCGAICPTSARTRTSSRSTAGISTTRCSISATSRSTAMHAPSACSRVARLCDQGGAALQIRLADPVQGRQLRRHRRGAQRRRPRADRRRRHLRLRHGAGLRTDRRTDPICSKRARRSMPRRTCVSS